MPSADEYTQAIEEVERTASALQESLAYQGHEIELITCKRAVEDLFRQGVVGPIRKRQPDPPMIGQTTIDDHLERGSE